MKFLIIAGFSDSLIGFRKPLIQALLSKGVNVHTAAPNLVDNSKVAKELLSMGVKIHNIHLERTGLNPLSDTKSLIDLYKLMRVVRPTHMLAYTIKPVIYGTIAAWISRVPNRFSLITGLAYAFQGEKGNIKRKVIKSIAINFYRVALKHSSLVFFQNPDDEALFRNLSILDKNSKTYIVNGSGVELEYYQFQNEHTVDIQAPVFLLIARLLGDKGIREYALAAAEVKKKYPSAIFNLAGWIDDNPNAIRQSELDSWIGSGQINYLGRLEDVRPAIKDCSVYVLPSYGEGTPRSVLEAMSMGRAVITTDVPGCRETVIDGENGFLIAAKDYIELSNAMLKFIEQPELINNMGVKSREIAVNKYDVNKVNLAMLKAMGVV